MLLAAYLLETGVIEHVIYRVLGDNWASAAKTARDSLALN